ncbi:MAG: hypothetical protein J6T13_09580 [Bacteroidales bacterium]|nr:hypothetical protein [Bacteroidales bacterium]
MKRIILLFGVFILNSLTACFAQTDYSHYLDKAMQQLEAGDCDAAQKYYNVYKELSGKTVVSVEVLIGDCGKEKTYNVGDYIDVGDEKYQVVYIRDGGKHGLAVLNKGWQKLYYYFDLYVTRKGIPTLDEMKLIYSNRDVVRLYDIYWTCTPEQNSRTLFFTHDFSTGKITTAHQDSVNGVILLIHRF